MARRVPMMMEHVRMEWVGGEEAVCPRCGNRNACLSTGSMGKVEFFECRDCHVIYAVDHGYENKTEEGEGYDRRVAMDARIITRRLGKSCSDCGSFQMKELSYEEREHYNKVYPGSRPTHICKACNSTARY